ncbi:MAG: alpha/beta hydrolase [Pseudohongiellaceae bacterium]|nr:alpha/beta hydrolase [Pseudohongiellaceae bacterium]
MLDIVKRLLQVRATIRALAIIALSCTSIVAVDAQERRQAPVDAKAYSINLEDVPYPYPVSFIDFELYEQPVRMVYMDVAPTGPANGKTVVLLHGMNWYAEYWGETIALLAEQGYRVIAPDQIGFGRSSKPLIPYSLHDHVTNTKAILDELGVEKAAILGHSMGGAIATRFAFSFPAITTHLVLVNPIAMVDSRLMRSWSRFQQYSPENDRRDYEAVRRNIERYFYSYDDKYDRYIDINYGWTLSSEWPRLATVRSLNSQWLYQDTIVYDRPHIQAKTLFLSGAEDGRFFRQQAADTVADIPNAELNLIEEAGHIPFFEKPDEFYPPLIEFLATEPLEMPERNR